MQMRKEREGGKGGVGSEEDVGKLTKCEHDSSLILFAAQGHLIGYILVVQTKILLTFYLQNAFVANGNWHRTQ